MSKKILFGLILVAGVSLISASIATAQPVMQPTMAPVMAPAMQPAMVPPATPAMAPVMAPVVSQPVSMAPATPQPAKPATAQPAKSGKKDTWWQVLLGNLIQIVLLFVLALAVALGKFAVQWVAKKMKVEDAEHIAKMEGLYDMAVTFGVNFASQQAHKMKNDPDSKGQRLNWALEKAQEMIKEYKLPDKSADWVKGKIEAKIGEKERA
jgi:hypothetical protein